MADVVKQEAQASQDIQTELWNNISSIMKDYTKLIFPDNLNTARGAVHIESSDVGRIIAKLKLYLQTCPNQFYKDYKFIYIDLESKTAGLLADVFKDNKFQSLTTDINNNQNLYQEILNIIRENEKALIIFRGNPSKIAKDDQLGDFLNNVLSEVYTRLYAKHRTISNTRMLFITDDWQPEKTSSLFNIMGKIEDRYPTKEEIDKMFNLKYPNDPIPYFPALTLEELRHFADDIRNGNYRPIINHIIKRVPNDSVSITLPLEEDSIQSDLNETMKLIEDLRNSDSKGVLLLGLPGTGKTFLAQTLATKSKVPVIKLDLASIYGSLVGESEKNIQKALATIRAFDNAFVILDEFDKTFSHGKHGQDAGTSERVIGILLQWLSEEKKGQFVIAMSNHPEKFEKAPEVLRRGRFDLVIGFPTPPKQYIRKVAENYAKKYNLPVDEKLLSKDYLVPADVAAFYDLASKVGIERAHKLFRTSAETIGIEEWKKMENAIYKMTGGITVFNVEQGLDNITPEASTTHDPATEQTLNKNIENLEF